LGLKGFVAVVAVIRSKLTWYVITIHAYRYKNIFSRQNSSLGQKRKARNNQERKCGWLVTSYPSNKQLSQQLRLEMVVHVMKVEDGLKLFDMD
jgi:hypothetical protein